jgi:hypothetical protein
MQSVQWSLDQSEVAHPQATEPTRSAASMPEKLASSQKEQSDRQAAAESMHAAFVWLFGPGCI